MVEYENYPEDQYEIDPEDPHHVQYHQDNFHITEFNGDYYEVYEDDYDIRYESSKSTKLSDHL